MIHENTTSKNLITVAEATQIVFSHLKDYGTEEVSFRDSLGRVLAENITADRDLPPFHRVTHDGIGIGFKAFQSGLFSFAIKGIQYAGDEPLEIDEPTECIEIMTGSPLPASVDTIVPYEDLDIKDGLANIRSNTTVVQHQFIHFQGGDMRQGGVLATAHQVITPPMITVASAVGKTNLLVKKRPKILIISTGNELVDASETPTRTQVRRSNNYMIEAALQQACLPADIQHLTDDVNLMEPKLGVYLDQYDILLLSGGVSMGKSDLVPVVLEKLLVKKLFHKIKQRPGKPFWFGKHAGGALVFAFPGNPVSSFMCLHRYFFPWIYTCFGIEISPKFAILEQDYRFDLPLQYFLQVKLQYCDKGLITAKPIEGNGSGDFVNLLATDAFMELPTEKNEFKKGETYRIWPFKYLI